MCHRFPSEEEKLHASNGEKFKDSFKPSDDLALRACLLNAWLSKRRHLLHWVDVSSTVLRKGGENQILILMYSKTVPSLYRCLDKED